MRFLGTDATIGLSPAQQKKRVQDNREAVADLIKHQEPEDLKQVIRDAAKGRPPPIPEEGRAGDAGGGGADAERRRQRSANSLTIPLSSRNSRMVFLSRFAQRAASSGTTS